MAKCSNCDGEISFMSFFLSGFTNYRVNFFRSKCNPIVTCKHCGTENVQETMSVLIGVAALFVSGLIVVMLSIRIGHDDGSRSYLIYTFLVLLVVQYVWWRFFTKLREP
jgi:hypothetical protein